MSTTPTRRPVPDTLYGGRLRGAYLLDLDVTKAEQLAPHVRGITVASPDLVGFEHEPGQHVMIEFPAGDRTVNRRYTIRRADPAAGTMDLEFDVHPTAGPATQWAIAAAVGDRLHAIGPRGNITVRADAASHVFVADDSAMPAVFAMLESLPVSATAIAVLVAPHGARSRPAPASTTMSMDWVAHEWDLHDVLAAVSHADAGYVFGEHQLVQTASELLRDAIGRDRIARKAYWRRGRANAPHGEPLNE